MELLKKNTWRKRHNHEIEKIIKGKDIRIIKAKRIQWLGHVLRMKDAYMQNKIMNGKLYNNRKRGRPKLRWLDGRRQGNKKEKKKKKKKKEIKM